MEPRTPYSLQTPEWLVFLRLLCAIAEGTFEIRVDVEPAPTLVDASACVYTVLNDSQSRLTVIGSRKTMPRSLGSVYGGAVTRFLGGFRGGFSRTIPAASHWFRNGGMAVSRDGFTLLVTDYQGGSDAVHIYCVYTGALLQTIGGYGDGPLQFSSPRHVCVSSDGFVFVSEWGNSRIQVLTPQYEFHAFVGQGQLFRPHGICADDDVIVVASQHRHEVCVFNRGDGALIRRFGSVGSGDGQLRYPTGVCFVSGHVAVADYINGRVSVWTLNGEFVRYIGDGELKCPCGVACSDAGELIVADSAQRVFVFSASDEIVWESAAGNFSSVTLHGSTIYCQSDGINIYSVFS